MRLLIIILVFSAFSANGQEYIFQNLGKDINTAQDEFLPVVYRDTLYFRRTYDPGPPIRFNVYKIPLESLVNNFRLDRRADIYNTSEYFNSFDRPDSLANTGGILQLDPSTPAFYNFSSDKLNEYKLEKPKSAEFNTEFNDMHPAMAPDGSYIVFSSDRPKSYGSTAAEKDLDLYITFRTAKGWSKPRNLKAINTSENDIAPFVAGDGSLYFSSKGYIRDDVNIAFSGEKADNFLNKSDVYLIKEKLNYNIMHAEATGDAKNPFNNAVMLPSPINTEFNEIGCALWKDSLLYISSDRLAPYDRPDPANQSGYDLYGFVLSKPKMMAEQPPQPPDFIQNIPFFVTGYYHPNTRVSLHYLRKKIDDGVFKSGGKGSYIVNPDKEYDERGRKIDYDMYNPVIENYLEDVKQVLLMWAKYIEINGGNIEVKITGYADPRVIISGSKYVEADINDSDFDFEVVYGTPMDNLLLSMLRAYFTGIYLKELMNHDIEDKKLLENIKWDIAGSGVFKGESPNLLKRSVKININYIQ